MTFPKPAIEKYGRVYVLRDDLIPGGTKRRVIDALLTDAAEFVYASPVYGYAQIALAYACAAKGLKATIFCAKRNKIHERTKEAYQAGAKIIQIPYGYLSNIQSKAKRYAADTGATLLPFGLDVPEFIYGFERVALETGLNPSEVWTVSGSAVLTRALQKAWPAARFYAVQVGAKRDCGKARVFIAPEKFEQDAKIRPPFPSCSNYDAKAWRFIEKYASEGALFWNVAG
jgi:hypothetical protein